MAKNSIGKMNPADQKDDNKQSYPKKGATDALAMGGKKGGSAAPGKGMKPPPFSMGSGANKKGKMK